MTARPSARGAHTPGPWFVDESKITIRVAREGYPHPLVKMSSYWPAGIRPQREEAEANCRLISSAPDLLAALKEACDMIRDLIHYANNHGGMYDDNEFSEGRAAIAKAEGGA